MHSKCAVIAALVTIVGIAPPAAFLERSACGQADCDGDGIDDARAIAEGLAADCNGNGVPDECDFLPTLGLRAPWLLPLGTKIDAVAAADFDGDGLADLAAAFYTGEAHFLAVLANRGLGRFEERARIPLAGTTASMTAADFDRNGATDFAVLAASNNKEAQLQLFLGAKDGTFAARVVSTGNWPPNEVAAADMNGDGAPDLVVSHHGDMEGRGDVAVFLNDGAGDFGTPARYPSTRNPACAALGDIDGNGTIDVVLGFSVTEGAQPVVMRNPGDGTLGQAAPVAPVLRAFAVALADIDADGDRDLLVVTSTGTGFVLRAFENDGSGAFAESREAPAELGAHTILATDLNGDGRAESALATSIGITVVTGLPRGETPSSTTYRAGGSLNNVAAGDFDGDGRLDLAAAVASRGNVAILRQQANVTFDAPMCHAVSTEMVGLAGGDINGDGRIDLVAADSRANQFLIYYNQGGGRFDAPTVPSGTYSVKYAACVDVDGNGALDLAGPSILRSRGDGTFEPPLPPGYLAGDTFAFADFDADGDLDLAHGEFSAGSVVHILLNDGAGTLAAAQSVTTTCRINAMCSADFNRDGSRDIAVLDLMGNVQLLANDGSGTFTLGATCAIDTIPNAIAAVDYDGDGDVDIATVHPRANAIDLLRNRGNGTFDSPRRLAVEGPVSLAIGDVDLDDVPDLIVGTYTGLVLLCNLTGGDFAAPVLRTFGEGVYYPRLLDLDGTGALDLAWLTSIDGTAPSTLAILLNDGRRPFDTDVDGDGIPDSCKIFARGDVTANLRVNVADAVALIAYIFAGAVIPCPAAADVNDDGRLDAADAVQLLGYLFKAGPPPPPPFGQCGVDPTRDQLPCPRSSTCTLDG
jgi:hypothetical protein